jgi:two-component system chemotaxis sensor kinase CheA
MNKRSVANLVLSSTLNQKEFNFTFKDDGRGIQINKLIEKAQTMKKYSKENLHTWDKENLAKLIFEPGFTTALKANRIAGRGVGLDLIKNKLSKIKGNIQVKFEEGKFCEFNVSIPIRGKKSRKESRTKKQRLHN